MPSGRGRAIQPAEVLDDQSPIVRAKSTQLAPGGWGKLHGALAALGAIHAASRSGPITGRGFPWSLIIPFVLLEELPRVEQTPVQLLLSRGDWTTFATRPLSAGLLIAALLMVVVVSLPSIKKKREEAFQED